MKTTEERASTMLKIEYLVDEWLGYVEEFGNECAYTDNVLEQIQKFIKEM